jgi:hypothetical protein
MRSRFFCCACVGKKEVPLKRDMVQRKLVRDFMQNLNREKYNKLAQREPELLNHHRRIR